MECRDCGEVVEDVKVCLGGQVGGPMRVRGLSIKRGITPVYEGGEGGGWDRTALAPIAEALEAEGDWCVDTDEHEEWSSE